MDRAIKAANKKLNLVTMDEDFERYYTLRQMALSDYTTGINHAREEGLAEGRAEERQYLLEMLDQGLTIEEIKRRLAK